MSQITEKEAFRLRNGEVLWSLKDLKDKLPTISEEDFVYHVSNPRNDFSNWIEGVFGKAELAKSIRRIKTKKGLLKKLEETLN